MCIFQYYLHTHVYRIHCMFLCSYSYSFEIIKMVLESLSFFGGTFQTQVKSGKKQSQIHNFSLRFADIFKFVNLPLARESLLSGDNNK